MDRMLWHLRLEVDSMHRLESRCAALAHFPADATHDSRPTFRLLCLLEGICGCEALMPGQRLSAGDMLVMSGHLDGPMASSRLTDHSALANDHPSMRAIGVTGALSLAGQTSHSLITVLPDWFIVRSADISSDGMQRHPAFMIDQVLGWQEDQQDPTIGRLFEVLAIRAIKTHYRCLGPDYRFMHALHDPEIGRAILAMHAQPGHNWTLERLAEVAQLSRSAFCQRFTELTGMPAMKYLTRWRMHVALAHLRDGHGDLDKVSRDIGYRSPTAFQKAFKRVYGLTPCEAIAS